ncbi:putative ammonium transporter 3 [Mytilus edulis]|uniref:putative ammonium transporter 3 n=1 Tax=Mytilus edulis TaxID=6550 RepID=UPI0039EE2E1A
MNMANNSTTALDSDGAVAIVNNLTWDDATWILTSSFIIFTMQSGFGLLESGAVTRKNEVNIMIKNAADVIFGGISYWMVGFGISFGKDEGSNGFIGVGYFFVDSNGPDMGQLFATFVFQLSFATTATTIVSGAMAERTKLTSYMVYSFFNTYVYCIPAHWVWDKNGFLNKLGCVDIAGSGVVHLCGGTAALVATYLLKPRTGRYENEEQRPILGNPVNTILGLFMLWWGWLGFNCGSTFGISGGKWKLAAKSAVITMNGSVGAGFAGIVLSVILYKGKYDVSTIVNSVLGGMVGVTASCAVIRPWEAVITGAIGGILSVFGTKLLDKMKLDDPVGAISVHGVCGLWGMLAVGIFAQKDKFQNLTMGRNGLVHGGGFYLLGVQVFSCVSIMTWSIFGTFLILWPLKKTVGIRLSLEEEELGADFVEHNIDSNNRNDSNIIFSSRRTSRIPSSVSTITKDSSEIITISENIQNATNRTDQNENNAFYRFLDQVITKMKRNREIAPADDINLL